MQNSVQTCHVWNENCTNPVAPIRGVEKVAKKMSKPGRAQLNAVDDRFEITHINDAGCEYDPQIPTGTYYTVHGSDGRPLELFVGQGVGHLNSGKAGFYD